VKLHAIKAFHGDCLLLESSEGRFILIDGGPPHTYDDYAADYLEAVVGPTGTYELVVVSHVDADHIIGVLDLFAELERRTVNHDPVFNVGDLWHNAFTDTIDTADQEISQGIQSILDFAGAANMAMTLGQVDFLGISEGYKLERSAKRSGVPINAAFGGAIISPDSLPDPIHKIGTLSLRVVGPTKANLDALRQQWLDWVRDNLPRIAAGEPDALANVDKSVPNLSSIVLLAEEGGKRFLLTGDARGDHILQGLSAAGLLDAHGGIDIDLLKVQHHGSDRNTNSDFFRKVRAATYVISANGKYGNPDLETLEWIVDAAHARGQNIHIVVTNDASSLAQIAASRPSAEFGYALTVADQDAILID
jgi:beta-lactamase superfamily II metal-dependent hydrolase